MALVLLLGRLPSRPLITVEKNLLSREEIEPFTFDLNSQTTHADTFRLRFDSSATRTPFHRYQWNRGWRGACSRLFLLPKSCTEN